MKELNPNLKLSVVLCTHNPREIYLRRTLDALARQTMLKFGWEFILIDNRSEPPLAGRLDLSWHPQARIIAESEPGIAAARSRGMLEASAGLILFVDDDNVLADDYLEAAVRLAEEFPQLGAFGGQLFPEFETPPAPELRPHLGLLALREFSRDEWCNFPLEARKNPVTAGMCLRREVAAAHLNTLASRSPLEKVGSSGKNLLRGEDDDICYTAGELRLGVGQFVRLRLTHLIPKERLTVQYLTALHEGIVYSGYVLSFIRGCAIRPPVQSWRWRLGFWRLRRRMSEMEKHFADAQVRAEEKAWQTIRAIEAERGNSPIG